MSFYLSVFIYQPIHVFFTFWIMSALNLPGKEFFINYWMFLILFNIIFINLGIFIGFKIFDKIKDKKIVKIMRS